MKVNWEGKRKMKTWLNRMGIVIMAMVMWGNFADMGLVDSFLLGFGVVLFVTKWK